jgi:hypothetical protein
MLPLVATPVKQGQQASTISAGFDPSADGFDGLTVPEYISGRIEGQAKRGGTSPAAARGTFGKD